MFSTGPMTQVRHRSCAPGRSTPHCADRSAGTGWLAIEPLPTAIFWIEQSSLEIDEEEVTDAVEHDRRSLAWVNRPQALIRSGHPQAKLPGPPRGTLPRGTMVQLVDRPPLSLGQGPEKSRWLAIVPPADQVSYVRAEGVRWLTLTPTPPVPPAAEVRASYEEPMPPKQAAKQRSNPRRAPSSWPPGVSAELQRIDGISQVIIASQPIEKWRFETVRAGYQDLLKRAGDQLELEEALRMRLNRLTQYEQAARAARTIESILAKSHRRDRRWPRCAKTSRGWNAFAPAATTPSVSFSLPSGRSTATRCSL